METLEQQLGSFVEEGTPMLSDIACPPLEAAALILVTVKDLLLPPASDGSSDEQDVRRLQAQAVLRDRFYQKYRDAFLEDYPKRKRKKSAVTKQTVQADVAALLSAVAVKIPFQFPAFLKESLKLFSRDTQLFLCHHFEVESPSKQNKKGRLEMSPRKPLSKRKRAQLQPVIDSMESTTPLSPAYPQQVNLLVPVAQTNALLAGRSVYRGSNFNANLSNCSALYHQVTTTTTRPKPKTSSKPLLPRIAGSKKKAAQKAPTGTSSKSSSNLMAQAMKAIQKRRGSRC